MRRDKIYCAFFLTTSDEETMDSVSSLVDYNASASIFFAKMLCGMHGQTTSRSHPRHGFTQVELLVVIAVIAILASMLLPTLQHAMSLARNIACLNNMKQIYSGAILYTLDNNEILPCYDKVDPTVASPRGGLPDVAISEYLNETEDGIIHNSNFGALQHKGFRNLFICPAVQTLSDFPIPAQSNLSAEYALSNYSPAIFLGTNFSGTIPTSHGGWFDLKSHAVTTYSPFRKISVILSATVLFAETAYIGTEGSSPAVGRPAWFRSICNNSVYSSTIRLDTGYSLGFIHDYAANTAMIDGSVRNLRYTGSELLDGTLKPLY